MKKHVFYLGITLILLGCSKDRLETGLEPNPGVGLQPKSTEILKDGIEYTPFGLPKPIKPKASGLRMESGILYYLSDYGYVYGKSSNYFRKQITAYAQNSTGSEAMVRFEFATSSCVVVESIDNIVGGDAQLTNNGDMVWNPANLGGEFMDANQTCSVTFTIRLPYLTPYFGGSCVEGSVQMGMIWPSTNSCNFTDDYAYLLPLINE